MALAELVVKLGLDADKFSAGLTSAQASVFNASRDMSASVDGVSQSISEMGDIAKGINFDNIQSKLKSSLSYAAGEIYSFGETVSSKINSTVKGIGIGLAIGIVSATAAAVYSAYKIISGTFGFISGLITGDSYRSSNIDALIYADDAVKKIQKSLALSTIEAQALGDVVSRLGIKTDVVKTFESAATAMRTNKDELDRLGVSYVDQNGKLLDHSRFIENVKNKLDEYRDGVDRTLAANAIGAGSYEQINDALKVTDAQLEVSASRLGDYQLLISEGTSQAVANYKKTMGEFDNETKLTSQGFSNAIATNILPILTDLASFFKDGFPFAVRVFRGSLATITSLVYGLKTSFFIVTESILGSISALGDGITGLAKAVAFAFTGDFSKAGDAIVAGLTSAKSRIGLIGDNIVAQARSNRDAIALAYGFEDAQSIGGGRAAIKDKNAGLKIFEPPIKPIAKSADVKEQASDYLSLNKRISESIALQTQELTLGRALTQEEGFLAKLREDAKLSKIPLSEKENTLLNERVELYKAQNLQLSLQRDNFDQASKAAKAITDEREAEAKQYKESVEAIRAQKEAGANYAIDTVKNLKFENSLLLLNAEQRQIAIALRALETSGIDKQDEAYGRQRDTIAGLIKEGQKLTEVNKFFADLESASRSVFENILTNAKDPFKALKDLIKKELIDALFQLTAKKWIIDIQANLGGGASSSGGGGGILGTLFNAGLKFFTGRANGGVTLPGGIHEINERGAPEVFSSGGRDYLLAGSKAGMVTNGARAAQAPRASGAVSITQNFDNRGADPGSAARLQAVAERIKSETLAAVQAKANRGGSFARSLGRA